jgi:hypothetical protein
MSDHPRLPLVYATKRATDDATKILAPGARCLENIVAAAILGGSLVWNRPRGFALVHGDGWVATVRRCESRLGTGRKGWEIVEIAHARVSEAVCQ